MASKKVAVDLFYDVISPYSWIAFESLTRYSNLWTSMDLRLKPANIGLIMKGSQNKPPMMVPNKGIYMTHDLRRLSEFHKIPIRVPSNFPEVALVKGTFNAMKFLTAIDMITAGKGNTLETLSRQLWLRVFDTHRDIVEESSLTEAARDAKVPQETIEKAIADMQKDEVKDRLKSYTAEALKAGSFGMPTIVAHLRDGPQMLFGSDRIEILAFLLREKYDGPVTKYSKL